VPQLEEFVDGSIWFFAVGLAHLALDQNGRFLALDVGTVVFIAVRGAFTNTVPIDTYRSGFSAMSVLSSIQSLSNTIRPFGKSCWERTAPATRFSS
jgi:hypothetical protein